MSALVSRILLAVLMIPAAAVVYLITHIAAWRAFGYGWKPFQSIVSGFCTWAFVALYWYALWRGCVQWTSRRVLWTFLSAACTIVVGFMAGMLVYAIEDDVGAFVGCVSAPLLWLIVVTLIWRETPRERGLRLKGTQKHAIVCPHCGYNLTGLQSTRCPECGTLYTLDELFIGQPSQAEVDVAG